MVLFAILVFLVVVWCLQRLCGMVHRLRRAWTYRRVPPSRLLWVLLHFLNAKSSPDRWSACIHCFVNMASLWASLWFLSGSEG